MLLFCTVQNKVLPRQHLHISRNFITVQHGGPAEGAGEEAETSLSLSLSKKENSDLDQGLDVGPALGALMSMSAEPSCQQSKRRGKYVCARFDWAHIYDL
jgi:hypothetical protein